MSTAVKPNPLATLKKRISLKWLLVGLGTVALIYLLIVGYIILNSKKTIEQLEVKLASETVDIEREGINITEEISVPKPAEVQEHITEHIQTSDHSEEQHTESTSASHQPVQPGALAPAPIKGLYEKTKDFKTLPIVSEDGQTPFNAYKKPFSLTGQSMIAIIVSDYGLSEDISALALNSLPKEVSFLLSPYASNPDKFQKTARENGHEIWLQVPMETEGYPIDDPGPRALLSTEGIEYNEERLEWVMGRTSGYAGLAAKTDQTFSKSRTVVQGIFKDVFARGLGFLELNPDGDVNIETIALARKGPYARNTAFLETISLKDLEKTAREKGYAIGVLKPYPNAIKALKTWTDTLDSKGLTLAPVSAIAELSNQ